MGALGNRQAKWRRDCIPKARNLGEDVRLALTIILPEQLPVLVLYRRVAFAGGFLQTFHVQDLNFAATILDHARALQHMSHGRHACPSNAEHLGKEFLREGQIITS
jgi:hypothetical protein